jgi:hypothetical protein
VEEKEGRTLSSSVLQNVLETLEKMSLSKLRLLESDLRRSL